MRDKWVSPVGDEGIYELDTAKWRTYKPVINEDLCINCRLCAYFCPVSSIKLTAGEKIYIDLSYCKGCGICSTECPRNAIDMVREGDE